MYNTHLMAVQENGQKLVMMDGTIWIINPEDIKKTCNWDPPCGIHIKETDINSEYDYSITNIDNEVTAKARKRR